MPLYNGTLFQIDKQEVMRYAKLNPKNPEFPADVIDDAIRKALSLAEPRGIWQILPYAPDEGRILGKHPFLLQGHSIRQHLSGAHFVGVLAVTVGAQIEQASSRNFQEGKYLEGLLLDAAATAAVEALADQLDSLIQEQSRRSGQKTVWRFSPGYGDWPVTQQNDFAALIGAEEIGITVTDHSMLLPRKSVTAVIGISGCGRKPLHNKCSACSLTTCPFRETDISHQGGSHHDTI